MTAYGVYAKYVTVTVVGLSVYSIFTFPSITILIQVIGNRVGSNFDLIATGNVFTASSAITCLLIGINDLLLSVSNDKRMVTAQMMAGVSCLTLLNALLCMCGNKYLSTKFSSKIK